MNLATWSLPGGFAILASLAVAQAATVNLPSSIALPAGSSTSRGFVVRVAQAPAEATVANNAIRAYKQINRTLTDSSGTLVPDVAFGGPEAGGSYAVDTINFEKEAGDIFLVDLEGSELGAFTSQVFPGIPGADGTTEKFATEVVAYLDLPAGSTTFGVSTTAERTDINDDDGYQVFFGLNPRDFFSLKVADYERIAPGFQNGWRNENQFTVVAPSAGLYPVRILYWQTGNGASLTFYTIASNGARSLVNDPNVEGALKAYRDTSVAAAKGPYVAEAAPPSGSEGNPAAARIEAYIFDGATTVATSDVKLFLNDVAVTPQTLTKTDGKTYVGYDPNASRTNPNNLVRLEYKDSAGTSHTNSWSFGIVAVGGSTTQVTGQWDFDNGDLSATVGTPLAYFDGPTGLTQQGTRFGTTTALGVPDINGVPAKVMEVPGDLKREIGYLMTHGIAPNGGGTRVNQYTLIMDVYCENNNGAASLLQTSSTSNTDDGDLFWQGGNFGQGGGDGYAGRGLLTGGTWHRIVAAYDMAATPPVVVKFVDGVKQDDWNDNQGLDNTRRSMGPTAILFADGDQDERRQMWVNSVQVRNGRISDAEAFALGGPSAAGIPQSIPQSNVTGMWDFEFKDLGASIGSNLQYFDSTYDGPDGAAEDKTTFGTTTELGIPDINGVPANVMRVPGTLTRQIGYVMDHRIAPNGGGTRVNQYTIIMDVYCENNNGAHSLLQTSSTSNTDDGDLFWQGANFGQGSGDGYAGRGLLTGGTWHRIVAAYDMKNSPPLVAKFVDGIKQDDWTDNQGLDNTRRSMGPTAILFADGDQDERREMWVSSVQVRSGRLSDAEIVLMGGPSAAGIPVVLPTSNVTGQWDFDYKDLGASIGSNLQYFDPTYDGPNGAAEDKTAFGTTTELGIPDIGGQPATVMRIPGTLTRQIGYIMEHRILPNGGGTRVNQYTLVMDLYCESNSGAASLLQTSSLSNTDDGDLFWQGGNFGQGSGDGYTGTGALTGGEWHRLVAAYNMAANPPVVIKYVDGIYQDDWTDNQGLDNTRRAMAPTAILFADGDQDERREMWVNSIQVRSAPMSPAEMEALGTPTANGIPLTLAVTVPTITVTREASGDVVLTYVGTLQSSATVNGTFAPVAGATSPYRIPAGSQAGAQLYRASN
ncbi:MAG: hypothetical protein J0M24_01540 [Verrucomicrobia bacterium]|nr:hypothetical protein [Verrucomicrobiota bacterium]